MASSVRAQVTIFSHTDRAYIGISYGNNVGAILQGIVTVSMADTGFQGEGITLNASAIPAPSTYAAILGGLALVGVIVQRRRARPNPPWKLGLDGPRGPSGPFTTSSPSRRRRSEGRCP